MDNFGHNVCLHVLHFPPSSVHQTLRINPCAADTPCAQDLSDNDRPERDLQFADPALNRTVDHHLSHDGTQGCYEQQRWMLGHGF